MTYNFRVGLRPDWFLAQPGGDAVPLHAMLALLGAIDATGNIAGACRQCGVSYRHAWGLLRRFEEIFGTTLLITRRRQGTQLSPFAERLLWANRRIEARLTPMLDSLASELQEELERLMPESEPHLRLHASHGFAVEALMARMAASTPPVELRYRTGQEALASLARGECDVAGFQVPVGGFAAPVLQRYAPWLDREDTVLVHLAVRQTGLIVMPGNPKAIQGVVDLARADVRFVNRQQGSSTRLLVDLMLAQAGVAPTQVSGYDISEFTHMAVAAHIASGMADTGVGVQTAATRFSLDFVPLVQERYVFAIKRGLLPTQRLQALLTTLRSDAFRADMQALAGYDATRVGQTMTVTEAFG